MKKESGQLLVELLIAMGVFVLSVSAITFLILDVYLADRSGRERMVATFLAKEGLEATRAIRDNEWHDLSVGTHGIVISENKWVFQDTPEAKDISDRLEGGLREIIVEQIDSVRRKVTSRVTWAFTPSRSTQVNLVTHFTHWAISDWYDFDWSYRKKITILDSQVTADLTNFPVLISTTDLDLTKAKNNGDDILFTLSDGTTKISHETEKFNNTTGELVAWVGIPSLSSSQGTDIYIYYGNSTATNQQNPTAVWDSNYVGVWHLKESGNGSFDEFGDSTSNTNHGQGRGTVPLQVLGKISEGQELDGIDKYISVSNSSSLQITDALTIEEWINLDSFGSGYDVDIVARKGRGNPNNYELAIHDTNVTLILDEGDGDGLSGLTSLSSGNWYHVAGTWDGTTRVVYLNGAQDNSDFRSGTLGTDTRSLYLGGRAWTDLVDGIIDEVRISNIARSAEWISTQYNNQNSPSTFYIVGSEESI